MTALLQRHGERIFRYKGILAVRGHSQKFVFQVRARARARVRVRSFAWRCVGLAGIWRAFVQPRVRPTDGAERRRAPGWVVLW